ncbi:GerAB/ArcD/ProY family transporter [Bacillus gobiensis]|uniref:GerAB/ArcD/ProY family transporter n=1 Tax=Bacillus gobiensis TaxID=1441095 RepID=UPI003D1E6B11
MCGGIVLFFIHYYVMRQYPNLPLTGYARKIFGNYIGWTIGLLYVTYFLYIAARNLREFGDLLISSTLPNTPALAVNILMILAVCYVLYLGIEVVARSAEVFIIIMILLGVAGNLAVLFSGYVDFHQLQPFLENGWKPVFTTAFPRIIAFPFGEMIVFTMLYPYLNRSEAVKKVWLSAIISSGLILSYTTALNIAVLGVENVERSTFPLLSTIGKVNLFDFIQRLDVIVVFTLLLTVFFKAIIYFYCAVIGMADLFKLNFRHVVFPTGVILLILSMAIASNFVEHSEEGRFIIPYYLHSTFLISLPLLMLLVVLVRSRLMNKTN